MSLPGRLKIARSRSLLAWTVLAGAVIVGSYVLTILLGALCFWIPLSLLLNGFGVVWGTLLLAFGIVVDIVIVRALVSRREKFQVPGILLDLSKQPRLAAEIESIAAALGQPMPREVYIIGVSNAFAAERTDVSRRENRRILGLGFPLLATLTVSEFRAIVAHEFAHFYSGDTRLGPWVYSSRATMGRVLINFHTGSAADLLRFLGRFGIVGIARSLVLGGITAYWKLLLRVTNLLSRRQEYRSDELACNIGGSTAFAEALQVVHTTAATFLPYWNSAVGPVVGLGFCPPLADGYSRFLANPAVKQHAAKSLDAQLKNAKENSLDTHPPLHDRIRRASQIPDGAPERNSAPATTLLEDLDSIEAELIAFLLPASRKNGLRRMDWDTAALSVYAPSWKAAVLPHVDFLGTRSIGQLPAVLADLKKSPLRMADPPGMLLTREQREERASSIFWMAMSLNLVDAGWTLHMQPGENWIALGNERIDPPALIRGLRSGNTSQEQWMRYCEKLGIADLPLSPLAHHLGTSSDDGVESQSFSTTARNRE